ncbi:MAG TPA: FG-GAP-like repeat-containing protein [Pyrinomonadaceae bacterium]|nr:FG-GAP-like repeat-containing protein [Pyrinomonadaceae bacterium]
MKSFKRKVFFVKMSVIFAVLAIAAFGFIRYSDDFQKVSASAQGPSPSFTNAPGEANCTACHTSFPVNSGTGNVLIAGVPANYLPNKQVPITITVNQESAVTFGFQVTAVDSLGRTVGTVTLPSGNPQRVQTVQGIVNSTTRTYVEHTVDGIVPTQFDTNSWTFTWNTPAQRVGKVTFYAAGNGANSDGGPNGDYIYTTSKATLSGSAISNFDNDGLSDVAVFRPSSGVWYSLNSTNGNLFAAAFGTTGDKIVPGDYDGDGKTDTAVFRPSTATWFIQQSTAGFKAVTFGLSTSIPIPGDYDGDGKTDIAAFYPENGSWNILRSSDNIYTYAFFGLSTDKPVPGDYDADGKTDFAVYRASGGVWYVQQSTAGFTSMVFGANTDLPVQSDYDGDGKTDFAVFRPSNGVWYRMGSTAGFSGVAFGQNGDKPAPADFDGDGKTDVAVYRNGIWYALKSNDNSFFAVAFGLSTDIPVSNAFLVSGN